VTPVWQHLCGLCAYRITEIPRRTDGGEPGGDPGRTQRTAALVSAYHASPPAAAPSMDGGSQPGLVAVGWMRLAGGGPVQVVAAGEAVAGSMGGGTAMLALPGGARGQLLPPGALAGMMSQLPCWQAIGGISDGLLASQRAGDGRMAPSLEECLLPAWAGPFGWLVIAEPVSGGELRRLADEAASHAQRASGMADRFPEREVEARRLRHRHAELRQALSTGLWRVRLLAGGENPRAAARVAGLVCASADLGGLPYALAPARPGPSGAAETVISAAAPAAAQARYPFHASTELLAALARTPEAEIPGVRLTLRPGFDITPETTATATGPAPATTTGPAPGITLGQVLDGNRMPAGELRFPLESLNRHVFVCGATGAGKSQTIRGLLEAAARAGVPWLVVEPAKAEYRLMAARLTGTGAEVVRVRPGEADAIAAGLNPLEPAADAAGNRFPLQTHADLVRALFLAAFQSEEPFPQVLSAALTRVYEDAGWDLALGEPLAGGVVPGYPDLADLQRTAEAVVSEIGYSDDITANVLGFIKVRLSSLRLGTTGRFLEGGHPIDFARLLQRNAVLEIEDVGDDRDKAFLMGTVLIRLAEHLRMAHRHEAATAPAPAGMAGLKHLTVFEEAHRLLRRPGREGGAAAHAVEMFAGLLAEIRAYGEGLVIAEQIPARLIPDVIKNTAVKITHRLPAADDREAVGATMSLTEPQSRYLVTLAPGEAAVFTDGMDFPLLVKMPDGTRREWPRAAGTARRQDGAVTASPAGVVSPRSATCGAECAARPCTLRDMRAAQRALQRHQGIVLWAELAVLAHLTGWAMPVPKAPLLGLMRAMPSRLRDCALSHGVDAAVAARAPVISSRVSPAGLSCHVITAMRARVTRGTWLCQKDEPTWLAPAYQWALVLDALRSAAGPGAGPHPRSREWERTYGRAITGDTCAGQAGTVQRWYDDSQRDAGEVRAVAFGVAAPSAIERVAGTRADDEGFSRQLARRLGQFADCRWPLLYLTGTTPGREGKRE
jgi:hypothetical protein